jgi:hypothetical protein
MSGQGGYGEQSVGRLKKEARDMEEAITPMFDQFDESMKGLQLATGMTSAEIMNLASKMNVNLFDPTVKLTDVIAKLGAGMVQTAEQINQSLRDITIKSTSVFENFAESKQMEDALNAARTRLLGGDTSTEAFIDYYQKVIDYEQLTTPEGGVGAFLKRATGMETGEIYSSELAGVTRNAEFDALLKSQLDTEQTDIAAQLVTNIGQQLVEKGYGFSDVEGGRKVMQDQIIGLLTKARAGDKTAQTQLYQLEKAIKDGTFFSSSDRTMGAVGGRLASRLGLTSTRQAKRGTRVGGMLLETIDTGQMTQDTINAMSEGAQEIYNQMTQAFKDGLAQATDNPQWWTDAPPWWNSSPFAGGGGAGAGSGPPANYPNATYNATGADGPGWYITGRFGASVKVGDTSTSKALRATMGAHSKFNSMLPGKRMITSSWREWGLGSPSSDHATGRAYDLTGDNLQQYAKNITDAGGFAEFHGVAGQRHLHVVPPIGPIGDRSSPVSGGTTAGSTTYGGDSFNITVVEASDASATADQVIQKIIALQKQTRRRM